MIRQKTEHIFMSCPTPHSKSLQNKYSYYFAFEMCNDDKLKSDVMF